MDNSSGIQALAVMLPIIALIVVIIIGVKSSKKQQEEEFKRQADINKQQNLNRKKWFKEQGYTISKQIGKLLIDDEHQKWMVTTQDKVFDYNCVVAVKVEVDGQQVEVNAFSVNTTIKSMTVIVSTSDTLNALVRIPVVNVYGDHGIKTDSSDYRQYKRTAAEQEAFFNAVINQKLQA